MDITHSLPDRGSLLRAPRLSYRHCHPTVIIAGFSPLCLALACCFIAHVAAAADSNRIEAINKEAAGFKALGDFEQVERLRLQRLKAVSESTVDSPWQQGLKAIKVSADLVDKLRYKEAYDGLRQAWKPFADQVEGPIFGDIAVRMFEVAQQSLAIYRDALTDGSPNQVASLADLRRALEQAVASDPCSTEARTMLAFITAPDPTEAFLRAEVRPSLKRRNNDLLNISWREGAVLPWHAAVEHEKARNTDAILQDLKYLEFLKPNVVAYGTPDQKANVFQGIDGNFAPFQMFFGRFILMEIADTTGRVRPAMVFLDGKKGWRKKNLQLLWRTPTDKEQEDVTVAKFTRFFNQLKPTLEWELGRNKFALYDAPTDLVDQLLEDGVQHLAVTRAERIATGKFSDTRNDPGFLVELITAPTSRTVLNRIFTYAYGKVYTEHALVDLTKSSAAGEGFNPVLVLSDDDNRQAEPNFFQNAKGEQFLKLMDGNSLVYRSTGPKQAEFQVKFTGVVGHAPLFIDAIPGVMLQATHAGRVLADLLVEANYSEAQALEEIRKSFNDPAYIPPNFKSKLKYLAKQAHTSVYQEARKLLAQKGWSEPFYPGDDLRARYDVFGFRYLKDNRDNIVTHPALSIQDDNSLTAVTPNAAPFAFRLKDGRRAVDDSQIYTNKDYVDLADNIAIEFLPNMLARHPCLPSLGLALRFLDLSSKRQAVVAIPPEPFSAWMANEKADIQEVLNRLYKLYAGAVVDSCKYGKVKRLFVAMQLAAARDLAVKKYFHQSLVFYNDLVAIADLCEPETPLPGEERRRMDLANQEGLFDSVPNKERLEAFAVDLSSHLHAQRLPMLLEIEQAAVLRAAGLEKSADFLWRRIVDQYQLYTLPMIELSVDYAKSLGFDPSPRLEKIERDIAGDLGTISSAAADLLDSRAYISDAIREGKDDARAFAAIAELRARLGEDAMAKEKEAKQKEDVRLDDSIAVIQGMSRSVQAWVDEKLLFKKWAKNHLYRGVRTQATESAEFVDYTLAPIRVCPAEYSVDEGFFIDFDKVLPEGLSSELKAWAALPAEQCAAAPEAGRMNFILGWYWLDRGGFVEARTAFAAAARSYMAVSRKGEDIASLKARRNAIMMLLALASVTQTPPGVTAVSADFLDGLSGQAVMWQRMWFSKGYDLGHAARETRTVFSLLPFIRAAMSQGDGSFGQQQGRYYFVDYRFRFGAIPDNLFADAIAMRLSDNCPRFPDGRPMPPAEKKDPNTSPPPGITLSDAKFVSLCYSLVLSIDKDIMKLGK